MTDYTTFILRTPRLLLRAPRVSDAEAQHRILTAPANTEHSPEHAPPEGDRTPEAYAQQIAAFQPDLRAGRKAFFVVCIRTPPPQEDSSGLPPRWEDEWPTDASAPMIGLAGFPWTPGNARPEDNAPDAVTGNTGVLIDAAWSRRGLGAEALAGSLEWGFRGLGFARVQQDTEAGNGPYRGLLANLGLEQFGREVKGQGEGGRAVEWVTIVSVEEWEEVKREKGLEVKVWWEGKGKGDR